MSKPFDRRSKSNCWQPFIRQAQIIADLQAKLKFQAQILEDNENYYWRLINECLSIAFDQAPVLATQEISQKRAIIQTIIDDAQQNLKIGFLRNQLAELDPVQAILDAIELEAQEEEQEWS